MSSITQYSLKYRPQKWEEVYGQDSTVRALRERILKDDIPSAMMFQGPFGTGKTTIAQLFAAAVQSHDENGNPNWDNPACQAILNETFDRDTIRLDGSQMSGKSDVVDFMSSVNARPFYDRKKIILIEEADQISAAGMSSLLKVLENLKPWVCVILLSMQDKISGAIKSRCQYYAIKSLGVRDIMMNLKHILEQTGDWTNPSIPDEFRLQGLSTIATASQGSMRQAVQFLEQCVVNEAWTVEDIDNLIGTIDEEKTWKILEGLLTRSKNEKLWRTLIWMKTGDDTQHLYNYMTMLLSEAMIYKATGVCCEDSVEWKFKNMLKTGNVEELFYCITLHPQMNKPYIRTTDILSALSCYYEGVSFNPSKSPSQESSASLTRMREEAPIQIGSKDQVKAEALIRLTNKEGIRIRTPKTNIGNLDIAF